MTLRDIFLALLVIAIWGGNIIAIKIGVMEMPPPVLLTLRFALTALVFLPFIRWPGKQKFWLLFEISLYMSVMHQGLLFVAIRHLDASTMAILLQSQILFATILGWLVLKETIRWRTATGLAMGFSGLLMTLGSPEVMGNLWAFGITMLSTVSLAFSYIRMRQLKNVHPATFIGIINGVAVPFIFVFSMAVAPAGWLDLGGADWLKLSGVLIYQVLLVSLSHILWQSLLSRNNVATVASFVLLMPVVAILLSALILNETLDQSLIWGGALTLAGVAIVTVRKGQKKMPIESDPVT